jgi:carbon-monoxide dehydrogenase large subunit
MPHADHLPALTLHDHPMPSPNNPLGAKGAGEAGTAGAPAASMNAINDALRPLNAGPIVEMPITPERVLRALGKV